MYINSKLSLISMFIVCDNYLYNIVLGIARSWFNASIRNSGGSMFLPVRSSTPVIKGTRDPLVTAPELHATD